LFRPERLALLLCALLSGTALADAKPAKSTDEVPAISAKRTKSIAKPARRSTPKPAQNVPADTPAPVPAPEPAKAEANSTPAPSPVSDKPGQPAPAAQAQASMPVPVPAAQTAEEQLDLKVKTLEERVNELKEKIFRTKARLLNLQEMVIGGDVTSGAKAVLVHRNEMGSSFVLESVSYALDGAPIYSKVDVDGDLDKREEFEFFNGRIVPGNHQIGVKLIYRGHGYGLFSYLEGYRFKVQSSYTFNAEAGKVAVIKIVGMEKGGITTELKDRPAVRYDLDLRKEEPLKKGGTGISRAPAPAPTPEASPAAVPAKQPATEAGSNGK
jgi:hypothetical protein